MSPSTRPDLLEKLKDGPVICAEGYLFEMERRGYVTAGPFVPTVVLEHPEAVEMLHREFARAGSDVVEAFTYYAHREKMKIVGLEDKLEDINRLAIQIARKVADETGTMLAGDICNTNVYEPYNDAAENEVRSIFAEQVGWAADEGVDFIIAETFNFFREAEIALEEIKKAGKTTVVTLAIHRDGLTRDGLTAEDACKRLEDAGADVVGLNCMRGPETIKALTARIRERVSCPVACLPVPYRTDETHPTFQSLRDEGCSCIPDDRPFPTALDPFTCNRYEIAEFTKDMVNMGVQYLGLCCGAAPHHIRSMAEALGRTTAASTHSPDMSKHFAYGTDKSLKKYNQLYAGNL